MIALWLIEFLLIALIVIALAWAVQQMIARARSRERAQSYAQELMRYDEARQLVFVNRAAGSLQRRAWRGESRGGKSLPPADDEDAVGTGRRQSKARTLEWIGSVECGVGNG